MSIAEAQSAVWLLLSQWWLTGPSDEEIEAAVIGGSTLHDDMIDLSADSPPFGVTSPL